MQAATHAVFPLEEHWYRCISSNGVAFRNTPKMDDRRSNAGPNHNKVVKAIGPPQKHSGSMWLYVEESHWLPLSADDNQLLFERLHTVSWCISKTLPLCTQCDYLLHGERGFVAARVCVVQLATCNLDRFTGTIHTMQSHPQFLCARALFSCECMSWSKSTCNQRR